MAGGVQMIPTDHHRCSQFAGAHHPTDAILRAEGLGWTGVFRELLRQVRTVEGEVLGRPGVGDRQGGGPDRRRGG